jgi:hypothetical protein
MSIHFLNAHRIVSLKIYLSVDTATLKNVYGSANTTCRSVVGAVLPAVAANTAFSTSLIRCLPRCSGAA